MRMRMRMGRRKRRRREWKLWCGGWDLSLSVAAADDLGSFSCKQPVIYGHPVNSCGRNQPGDQSGNRAFFWQETGPAFFSFMPNCFARQLALSSFSLQSQRVMKVIYHLQDC